MIKLIASATAGAFINYVRGGGHAKVRAKIESKFGMSHDSRNRLLNKKDLKLHQKIVHRLLDGKILNAIAFLLFILYMTAMNWVMAVRAGAAMMIGQAPGWGDYIGAMGGLFGNWRQKDLKENWLIDVPIKPLKRWPRIWGTTGLALRGILWTFFIALALADWSNWEPLSNINWWLVVSGGLMAPIYFIGTSIHQKVIDRKNPPWWPNEIAFGAVMWGLIYYLTFM